MTQTMFELIESLHGKAGCVKQLEGKVLRYDQSTRVMAISDGCFHFYAYLSHSVDDSQLVIENSLPRWIETIEIESSDKLFEEGLTQSRSSGEGIHDFVVTELSNLTSEASSDDSRRANESVLSTPWNLVGPMEINANLDLIERCMMECVEKGHTSELNEILRWSEEARMVIYDFKPIFDQTTPVLHGACYFGHVDIVKLVYKYMSIQYDILNMHNPDRLNNDEMYDRRTAELARKVNLPMNSGHSAFYLACQRGYIDIVKFLYGHGASAVAVVPNKYTPLSIAIECNHLSVVEYLLNHCSVGATGDGHVKTSTKDSPSSPSCSGHTVQRQEQEEEVSCCLALCPLLHSVVSLGRVDMLRVMLSATESFVKPSERGSCLSDGMAGLSVSDASNSIHADHRRPASLLTTTSVKVFDVNETRSLDGATPLFLACNMFPSGAGMSVPQDKLFPLSTHDTTSSSHDALKNKSLPVESIQAEIVSCLLEHGAQPDKGINSGHRPLYLAAQNGSLPVVMMLVNTCQVDINHEVFEVRNNKKDKVGWRAIDIAAKHNHYHIMDYLLHAFGHTSLQSNDASKVRSNDVDSSGDVNHSAKPTVRAVELAVLNNSLAMVRLLLEADPQLIGYISNATLSMSIIFCRAEMVDILLKYGINPNNVCEFYQDFVFSAQANVPDWMKAGEDIYPLHLAIVCSKASLNILPNESQTGSQPEEASPTTVTDVKCLQSLLSCHEKIDLHKVCRVGRSFLSTAIEVKNTLALRLLLDSYSSCLGDLQEVNGLSGAFDSHLAQRPCIDDSSNEEKEREQMQFKRWLSQRCPIDNLTPMLQASLRGNTYAVKLLLKKATHRELLEDRMPTFNLTPLFIAANNGFTEIAQILILAGAEMILVDSLNGNTTRNVVTVAEDAGHFQLANWIRSYQQWSNPLGSSNHESCIEEHSRHNRDSCNLNSHLHCEKYKGRMLPLPLSISLPPYEVLFKLQHRRYQGSDNSNYGNFTATDDPAAAHNSPSIASTISQNLRKYHAVGVSSTSLSLALRAARPFSLSRQDDEQEDTHKIRRAQMMRMEIEPTITHGSVGGSGGIQKMKSNVYDFKLLPTYKLWPKQHKDYIIFVLLLSKKVCTGSLDGRDLTSTFIAHVIPFLLTR